MKALAYIFAIVAALGLVVLWHYYESGKARDKLVLAGARISSCQSLTAFSIGKIYCEGIIDKKNLSERISKISPDSISSSLILDGEQGEIHFKVYNGFRGTIIKPIGTNEALITIEK